jgi:chromosome segregation ATPase
MNQDVVRYRKRLEVLKNTRQEVLARKKVLKEEQVKLQQRIEGLNYKDVAELRDALGKKKEKREELKAVIDSKLSTIERALADE